MITVLLPVFNGAPYLKEAIESILCQSYQNFELLILDDASKDDSVKIALSYKDKRIRVYQNKKNLGLGRNLNIGLENAKGELIARMDADDVSLKTRLEKQANFLQTHKEIGICGTHTQIKKKYPLTYDAIKVWLLFRNTFAHSSVMFRADKRIKYDPAFIRAQDYDLWVRSSHFTRLANLPEVLLFHRIHERQISENPHVDKTPFARKVQKQQLISNLKLMPTNEELFLHWQLSTSPPQAAKKWLLKLRNANEVTNYYNPQEFDAVLEQIWLSAVQNSKPFGQALLAKLFHKKLL